MLERLIMMIDKPKTTLEDKWEITKLVFASRRPLGRSEKR